MRGSKHSNFQFVSCVILGSIAEREHKKWSQSVVHMRNNPYTAENVMLRKFSRNLGVSTEYIIIFS